MKFSSLAILAALSTPVAAEIYFKEQFNDEVCIHDLTSVIAFAVETTPAVLSCTSGALVMITNDDAFRLSSKNLFLLK